MYLQFLYDYFLLKIGDFFFNTQFHAIRISGNEKIIKVTFLFESKFYYFWPISVVLLDMTNE